MMMVTIEEEDTLRLGDGWIVVGRMKKEEGKAFK